MAESEDTQRPLNNEKCSKGWRNQREYCYWIPEADIEGEIPKDLYGTFFRNGPGLNEIYGTKLKHRK
jgi:all-trans-8'-apo-beta-carotenal 15,15'-oxygenase